MDNLQALRDLIHHERELLAAPKTGVSSLDKPTQAQNFGVPKGAITAISGAGKTSWVTEFLALHPQIKVAWIEKQFSVYPFAFLQKNISLDRVLFVEAREECDWAALQILKSQTFQAVTLYAEKLPLPNLRRLQLTAEKADAIVFWLTSHPQLLWPVTMELEIRKTPQNRLQTSILKRRF